MIRLREAGERGRGDHGWLDSRHTFSFADYHDREQMGFRSLRVINEDRVAPGQGFGTHGHRDMEIISYVLEGSLEHKDSLGNGSVLTPGEFQRMSAGTGVLHSEFNPSVDAAAHFYQIWILPERRGLTPSYEQRRFAPEDLRNRFRVVASSEAGDDALTIHQDARVLLSVVEPGATVEHRFGRDRHGWLQVLRGRGTLVVPDAPRSLQAGDGLALSEEPALAIEAIEPMELMLFELA